MTTHYSMGSTALIGRACSTGPSEHYDGRAWDWMLHVDNATQEAVAQSVLAWLTAPDKNGVPGAMARRFGIMYIIHNHKMWRSYATDRGWAPYYGTNPHTDHIHFSFNYDGAAGRTSWWTGVPTTSYLKTLPPAGTTLPSVPPGPTPSAPVPTTPVVLSYGMRSEAVRQLQVRLGNLPTTGYYGDLTKARVIAYQKFVGLPQTGVADLRTQEILATRGWKSVTEAYPTLRFGMTSPAVKTLQTKLGSLPVTGYFGSMTQARVTAYQRFVGLPQTGVADSRTQETLYTRGWAAAAQTVALRTASPPPATAGAAAPAVPALFQKDPAMTVYASPPDHAVVRSAVARGSVASVDVRTDYTAYKSLTIGPGARGAAVRVLQRALGGLAVDGVYGDLTRDKVASLQRTLAQLPTGVVTPELWDVLEARDFPFLGSRTTVLRVGDSGPAVLAVQRLLGVRETGVFDSPTRDAVRAAQARAGLASTGVVASRTWSLFDRLSA
jgi:peptidoglycan hydrolase-like protein with peptidoglycan-binding domain